MIHCSTCGKQNLDSAQFCIGCGTKLLQQETVSAMSANTPNAGTTHIQNKVVIIGNQKSAGVAFILTFLFGPLGLFYASVTGGFVMLLVSFVGILFFPLLFLAWIGSIIWSVVVVSNQNSALNNKVNNSLSS